GCILLAAARGLLAVLHGVLSDPGGPHLHRDGHLHAPGIARLPQATAELLDAPRPRVLPVRHRTPRTGSLSEKRMHFSRSAMSDRCSTPSAGFAGATCFGGGGSEGGGAPSESSSARRQAAEECRFADETATARPEESRASRAAPD